MGREIHTSHTVTEHIKVSYGIRALREDSGKNGECHKGGPDKKNNSRLKYGPG